MSSPQTVRVTPASTNSILLAFTPMLFAFTGIITSFFININTLGSLESLISTTGSTGSHGILPVTAAPGDAPEEEEGAAKGPVGNFVAKFTIGLKPDPGNPDEVESHEFKVRVHSDWAPIGAARFKELIENQFYDDTRFFRVIPSFMVQFGLNGDPAMSNKWRSKTIKDEPVKESNRVGTITFAKTGAPNSRTTQLFINYVDNARLDGMGFAPFGEVIGDGMNVVKKIHNCGEKPNQGQIQSEGNRYLDKQFPRLSKILNVEIVPEDEL